MVQVRRLHPHEEVRPGRDQHERGQAQGGEQAPARGGGGRGGAQQGREGPLPLGREDVSETRFLDSMVARSRMSDIIAYRYAWYDTVVLGLSLIWQMHA